MKKLSTTNLAVIAMLSAVAFVLAFIEIPMPLSPPFAMMDLSDLPALLAAFSIGPLAGALVEVIKNALQGNIFKGILISVMAMLVYKPLSPILHGNIGTRRSAAGNKEAA